MYHRAGLSDMDKRWRCDLYVNARNVPGCRTVSVTTAIAIYFVIWWIVLFAVLPWGVRSQEESGSVSPGTDPGAPVDSRAVAQAHMDDDRDDRRFCGGSAVVPVPDRHAGELGLLAWRTLVGTILISQKN